VEVTTEAGGGGASPRGERSGHALRGLPTHSATDCDVGAQAAGADAIQLGCAPSWDDIELLERDSRCLALLMRADPGVRDPARCVTGNVGQCVCTL
jgi:hypothetical protein